MQKTKVERFIVTDGFGRYLMDNYEGIWTRDRRRAFPYPSRRYAEGIARPYNAQAEYFDTVWYC